MGVKGSHFHDNWFFESLESRRLLSVSLKGAEIIVRGTDGDDSIVFRSGPGRRYRISINGQLSRGFLAKEYGGVHVDGRGGNDFISLGDLRFRDDNRIVIIGGDGADTLHGSMNNDVMLGGAGDDRLEGSGGDDLIRGDGGEDTLYGGIGKDTLRGGEGDDDLFGEADDDTLIGEGGADLLDGSEGLDTADYSSRRSNLTIRLDDAGGDGEAGENDKVLPSVEGILGGFGNDFIEALTPAFHSIHGNDGNDTINMAGGTAYGERGNDRLTAQTVDFFATNLIGGMGNDLLTAKGQWSASLVGEEGDDTLLGGDAADNLNGGDGNNSLNGGAGNDVLSAGPGRDVFAGGDGQD